MMYRTTSYDLDEWATFYFEKNLQGDIVAVYNSSGTKVARYSYSNAWGNNSVIYSNGGASTGAQYNPFRYRGYYYDTDLGMYYLQTRYYDSKICRFISPDTTSVLTATPMALTDKNLYAYCDNNPVMRVDGDGEFWNIIIGAVVGAVASAAISFVSQLIIEESPPINSAHFLMNVSIAAVGGAVSGGLAASGVGIVGQIVGNATIGAVSGGLNVHMDDVFSNDPSITAVTYVLSTVDGAIMGGISGLIGGPGSASKHVSNSFWRMVSTRGSNFSYYLTQIGKQAMRDGKNAIPSILKATFPSIMDSIFNILNQPVR